MNYIFVFLRGLLMGFCDIIPGVSGGTIAFITGIYERLLSAINNAVRFPRTYFLYLTGSLSKKAFSRVVKSLDIPFLASLFTGIILAVIAGSWLVTWLLANLFVYTISFFIGLIIVSSFFITKEISSSSLSTFFLGVLGFVIGIALAFVIPATVSPSLFFIFLAGFLAISAMFLPGISGSFILLILGMYEFMIVAIHALDIRTMAVFIVGAVLGAIIISQVIARLIKARRNATFAVLLGLVLGCLAVPVKEILAVWSSESVLVALACVLFGALLVWFVQRFS